MSNEKVFQMDFGKIYDSLLNKATRKGRTKSEVDEIICWLTGYDAEALEAARLSPVCYGDFFRNAPMPNPNRTLIKGVVCGIRVEEIEDPLMREIRYLDKLIDELAKGKPMEKILRSQEEPAMWVCPKCGRSFRRKDQDHYCGKAPETIEEYIRSQPEDVQPYLHQVNGAHQRQPPRGQGENLLEYAHLLEGPQPDSVRGVQEAHRPVPRPGGRGSVCRQIDGLQDQQRNHSDPLLQAVTTGID